MKYAKEGRSARRGLSRKINCLVMKDSLNVQDVQVVSEDDLQVNILVENDLYNEYNSSLIIKNINKMFINFTSISLLRVRMGVCAEINKLNTQLYHL